ncbi:TPA: hypothetical protein ACH3X3_011755 [Trebouxia sp. C0006]
MAPGEWLLHNHSSAAHAAFIALNISVLGSFIGSRKGAKHAVSDQNHIVIWRATVIANKNKRMSPADALHTQRDRPAKLQIVLIMQSSMSWSAISCVRSSQTHKLTKNGCRVRLQQASQNEMQWLQASPGDAFHLLVVMQGRIYPVIPVFAAIVSFSNLHVTTYSVIVSRSHSTKATQRKLQAHEHKNARDSATGMCSTCNPQSTHSILRPSAHPASTRIH